MLIMLQNVIYAVIVIALCFSVYYSFRSRREQDSPVRGKQSAKMNIALGITLVAISAIVLLFKGSSVRIVIGSLFLLLGLFNLFAGVRNLSFYSLKKDQ